MAVSAAEIVEKAIELGYLYAWIMDDDSIPWR